MSDILLRAIAEIGPRAYSPEQVAAWRSRHPGAARYRERVAAGDAIMVAVDNLDRPVGYVLVQTDGHLDAAETFVRSQSAERLFSEASDLARPVFERAGYKMTHRRDLSIDGVAIHNWAMEKPLG